MAGLNESQVQAYSMDFALEAGKRGSRLEPYVMLQKVNNAKTHSFETFAVESGFNEQVAAVEDTVWQESQPSRRSVSPRLFRANHLCSDMLEFTSIINLKSAYTRQALNALSNLKDKLIVDSLLGDVVTGVNGATVLNATADGVKTMLDNGTGLDFAKVLATRESFAADSVGNSGGNDELVMLITERQMTNLLGELKVTSSDYVGTAQVGGGKTKKGFTYAIRGGRVDSALGFKFIELGTNTNLLSATAATGGIRSCIAFAVTREPEGSSAAGEIYRPACMLAVNKDITMEANRVPGKNNIIGLFNSMYMNAVRTEGKLVKKVLCQE